MKISPIWIASAHGKCIHRKREYTKRGGRTLCGIKVLPDWLRDWGSSRKKCKRCAA